MSFLTALKEVMEPQPDISSGKYEKHFNVDGVEYAFIAKSTAGTENDNTEWMLEFENVKSHRIDKYDNNPKIAKAFAMIVREWIDEKQPYCFFTYGSNLETIQSIINAIKAIKTDYSIKDGSEPVEGEDSTDINSVGKITWSKEDEAEYISSEEKANHPLDKFEDPYEQISDIEPRKNYMTYKKDDSLEDGSKSYSQKFESHRRTGRMINETNTKDYDADEYEAGSEALEHLKEALKLLKEADRVQAGKYDEWKHFASLVQEIISVDNGEAGLEPFLNAIEQSTIGDYQ